MNKKRRHIHLLSLFFCLGVVAINSEGISTSNDNNTAIRVLLDKAIPKGSTHSLLYSTYYRTHPARGWIRAERNLEITIGPSHQNPILINSNPLQDSFVFIRGGKNASDKLRFHDGVFRGALKWVKNETGFSVINYISLDDYLLGTLGSEMSPSWEMEALKAQAVASRTYAQYMIHHPKNSEFDLEKTVKDQVYGGVDSEHPRVTEAVRSTAGQTLVFQEKPIKAFFHSRCGGSTETPTFVWNHKLGYPQKKVPCPYCLNNPFSWQTLVRVADLLKWTGLNLAHNFKIEDGERGSSGRLASLNVIAGSKRATIDTDTLRSHLGYGRLKSAKFDWRQEGELISFEGVGNGHGVGMCQWGARHLAQTGKNYREILAYYYPGTTLRFSN
ncbi:MAG: SpoIID/LytB domain-containing protein [Pseudomonadota bacterium]